MKFLWVATVGWALLSFAGALNQRGGVAFMSLVVAFAPLAMVMWLAMKLASNRAAGHAAALQAAGVEKGAGFDHTEGSSGIAINKEDKTLTLHLDGRWKTYPYADVRNWECVKERAGEMVGVGLHAGVAAAGVNYRAHRAAAANTGFFVTVRDVENPIWRIEMSSSGTQARWMEILRQDINER